MLGTKYTLEDLKDQRKAWRTTTLFEETISSDLRTKYPPLFSLCDEEYSTSGLPSLKYRYLQFRDTNEYLFAETYLGGWGHWQQLVKSWAIKPHIEDWRNELKMKLRSEYLNKVRDLSEGDGPASLQALKYLIDNEAGGNGASKRGRPSKGEKEKYLREQTQEDEDQREEAKRLGLN
jgi:hypothetical protein